MRTNFFFYLMPSMAVGVLGTLVLVPVTTYFLDPRDFGILAILSAILLPLDPLSTTGVTWVLSGNYFKTAEEDRKVLLFNVLFFEIFFKIFWGLLFLLAAPVVLPWAIKEFEPQYYGYFVLLITSSVLMSFWPAVSCLLVLQKRARIHAAFEVGTWGASTLAVILCLTVMHLKTEALFVGPVIAGIVSAAACLWYVGRYIRPRFSRHWIGEVVRIGLPVIPANLAETVSGMVDRYCIQRWMDLTSLGLYAHSQSYRTIFMKASKAMTRTVSPLALEIFAGIGSIDQLRRTMRLWWACFGVIGVGVTIFAEDVLRLLTHDKFTAAAPLVPIWFLFLCASLYGFPYLQFLVARKQSIRLMRTRIIFGLLGAAVLFPAVYFFGTMGAAAAVVLTSAATQYGFRQEAIACGSPLIAEREMLMVVGILTAGYFLMPFVGGSFFIKMAVAGVVGGIMGYVCAGKEILAIVFPHSGRGA